MLLVVDEIASELLDERLCPIFEQDEQSILYLFGRRVSVVKCYAVLQSNMKINSVLHFRSEKIESAVKRCFDISHLGRGSHSNYPYSLGKEDKKKCLCV